MSAAQGYMSGMSVGGALFPGLGTMAGAAALSQLDSHGTTELKFSLPLLLPPAKLTITKPYLAQPQRLPQRWGMWGTSPWLCIPACFPRKPASGPVPGQLL